MLVVCHLVKCGIKTTIHNNNHLISENIRELIFCFIVVYCIHWFIWRIFPDAKNSNKSSFSRFFCFFSYNIEYAEQIEEKTKSVFLIYSVRQSMDHHIHNISGMDQNFFLFVFIRGEQQKRRIDSKTTIFVLNFLFDFEVKKKHHKNTANNMLILFCFLSFSILTKFHQSKCM